MSDLTKSEKRAIAQGIIVAAILLTICGVATLLAMYAPYVLAGILLVLGLVALGWAVSYLWRNR